MDESRRKEIDIFFSYVTVKIVKFGSNRETYCESSNAILIQLSADPDTTENKINDNDNFNNTQRRCRDE